MIVFDTETTGLPLKGNASLDKQPQIIEYAGIKLDDLTLEEVDRMEFICKPTVKITAEITNITGLTNEDLADKQPFVAYLPALQQFYLGEKLMAAHNVAFDRSLMIYELQRLGMITRFPWPPEHICTVEKTYHIKGHRMKLMDLHIHCCGEGFESAHRAMADVEALVRCIRHLRSQEIL